MKKTGKRMFRYVSTYCTNRVTLQALAIHGAVRVASTHAPGPVDSLMDVMLVRMRNRFTLNVLLLGILIAIGTASGQAAKPLRLYIFDCGTIGAMNPALFDLKAEEIKGPANMITPCYLIVHSRGTLMWDAGQIADEAFPADGKPASTNVFAATKKLLPQLAELGYKPSDLTYFALSHYHSDHTANANAFAGSTWIVQEAERKAMFDDAPAGIQQRDSYSKLRDAKTMLLKGEDKDVFGDGTVVIKNAPGHTPGHQMLFLKLAKLGPVLLAGDLYHYPEEKTLDRVPTFDGDREMTRRTRKLVDAFVQQSGAQMWIQHDLTTHARLNKAPAFYE
jgi:glyoxylase-like metal-dependent hydrolase (beta-lactamase superfamily II)